MSFEAYGVRVSGSWRFNSGIEDATGLMLNASCPNHPDAAQSPRFLLLVAAHKVQKLDSRDSYGMAATGSHDVLTHQLRHWRDIQAMAAHRDVAWNDAMLACGENILLPVSTTTKPV